MKTILKFALKLFVFVFLLAAGGGFACLKYLDTWALTPLPVEGEVLVALSPGMPLRGLSTQLKEKNLISESLLFTVWMKINGDYPKFEAGSYLFKDSVTPMMIHNKLKNGETYTPLVLQVIVPEGFTLKMLINRLATKNVGKFSDLKRLVKDQKFVRSLGVKGSSLEGYIYPATYSFTKMPTSQEFFQKAVKTFYEKLPAGYESDLAKIGFTLDQAVTMASLIELETMQEAEKPMVAEVIFSRLSANEALGIDAAIIYGIEDYDGDLKWKDLKNKNNLYNTRLHRGLPPTPIGSVSSSSLNAILNPTKLGYYYYVVDSKDKTHHVFSKTLAEHNERVRKLLKAGTYSRGSNGN